MNSLEKQDFVVLGGPLGGTSDVLLVVLAVTPSVIIERLSANPWTGLDPLRLSRETPWIKMFAGGGLVPRLALLVLFLAVCICRAEEPIRVNVRLVNVAFTARDSRGALVDNLTKEDVEVFEDAVPQKVSFFARSLDVPLTLGLIVDFSGSQDRFSEQHQHDLEVFLKNVLGAQDRAFLIGCDERGVECP